MINKYKEPKPDSDNPNSNQFKSRSAKFKQEHKDEAKNGKEKFQDNH
ncbi:MAG: hypothetical protein LIR50_09385 [Bacillota bacterium]|nr:hypothetical protein [Bacillota bacterium]